MFGMELLAKLDLRHTNLFFATFFRLPDFYWRGFLSSRWDPPTPPCSWGAVPRSKCSDEWTCVQDCMSPLIPWRDMNPCD